MKFSYGLLLFFGFLQIDASERNSDVSQLLACFQGLVANKAITPANKTQQALDHLKAYEEKRAGSPGLKKLNDLISAVEICGSSNFPNKLSQLTQPLVPSQTDKPKSSGSGSIKPNKVIASNLKILLKGKNPKIFFFEELGKTNSFNKALRNTILNFKPELENDLPQLSELMDRIKHYNLKRESKK